MNVIIYVLDSLRPDFLSSYGYHKQTSPNIDWLCKQGVRLNNAYSVSTWTRPAGASILTGMYPDALGMETMDDYFNANVSRLPHFFKENDYKTIGISAMPNISSHYGYDMGFDEFLDLYKDKSLNAELLEDTKETMFKDHLKEDKLKLATAEDINNYIFRFLDSNQGQKFCMFVWSVDTHAPYFIRGKTDKFDKPQNQEIFYYQDIVEMKSDKQVKKLISIYEKMIYFNDYHLGKLIKKLIALKIYDETMIIVVSDHGESFMEHGFIGHNGPPYEDQIRILFAIKFPENRFAGIERNEMTQHIDILPTLMSHFNINEEQKNIHGKNLLPLITDDMPVHKNIYVAGNLNPLYGRYVALRSDRWKLIRYEREQLSSMQIRRGFKTLYRYLRKYLQKRNMLFDLYNDRDEKNDVASYHNDIYKRLNAELIMKVDNNRITSAQIEKVLLNEGTQDTEEIKKQLSLLGYL